MSGVRARVPSKIISVPIASKTIAPANRTGLVNSARLGASQDQSVPSCIKPPEGDASRVYTLPFSAATSQIHGFCLGSWFRSGKMRVQLAPELVERHTAPPLAEGGTSDQSAPTR